MRTDLFSTINPTAPDATSLGFARIIARRAQLVDAERGWSLAELNTSEIDYQWMQDWLRSLRRPSLDHLISSWSGNLDQTRRFRNAAVTGTMLWLLFTEHVRRRGTEGNFWNALGALPWHSSVADVFFLQDGNPTGVMRETLQAAAEAVMLRNVFGIDGMMPWFDTGFLQFGFTRTGFERRLPEWLAGQTPTLAIRHLLGLAGASMASRTFLDLWGKLTAYRRNNLGEAALRNFLGMSPWVLPEWIESLVKKSRERLSLDAIHVIALEDDRPVQFLDAPKLEWPSGTGAAFTAEWINLDALVLPAPTYVLRWGNRELGRLARQADGSFAPTTGAKVNLGWAAARGIATLEAAHNRTVVAAQPLILWDESELVNIYNIRGQRAEDAYQSTRIVGQDGFTVCVPLFVTLTGATPEAWPVPQQPFLFARFHKDSGRVAVSADGEELWSSAYLEKPPPVLDPGDVVVRLETPSAPMRFVPWEPMPKIRMKVEASPDLELRWIKWADQSLIPANDDGEYAVEIQPKQLSLSVTMIFGLRRNGIAFQARQKIEVPFTGTLWRTGSEVRVLEAAKLLSVRTAMSDEFRFRLPSTGPEDYGRHYLIEAGSVVRRATPHAAPIGQLAGYGGALVIRRGPYNESRDTLLVAEQVVDCGVMRKVVITATSLQIHFIQDMPLRPEHAVIIWNSRHEVIRLQAVAGLYPFVWEVPHQGEHGSIFAVGVFFNSVRVGSWFHLESWSFNLRRAFAPNEVRHAAIVLRWFHAPVLAASHVANVRTFMSRNLAAILATWLTDEAVSSSCYTFNPLSLDSSWINALEELAGRGRMVLDGPSAQLLFDTTNRGVDLHDCNDAITRLVQRLALVSSQLAVSFCRTWLDEHYSMIVGRQAGAQLKDHLRAQLQPTSVQWRDLSQNVLGVAEEFLENLAQKAINPKLPRAPADQNNIQLLAKHPAFRRYCAAKTI
jgi:hypothetical protein